MLPYGSIVSPLSWKLSGSLFKVSNPLAEQIRNSDFDNYFEIKNLQYHHTDSDLFVDIWIMT